MNLEEAIDLLSVAAAYDRRTVGEADAVAWHTALQDLPFEDAREAVIAHYTNSTDWLMPAHVRQRVRRIRDDRLSRTPLPAPPPELADQPGRYARAIRAGVSRIADGFNIRPAIKGAPRDGEPPAEWQQARESLQPPEAPPDDPREIAREQVAEARRERTGEPS